MDTNLVTQILWGRTTHVGCGWTQFPLLEGSSKFEGIYAEGEYENFFVCNYGVGFMNVNEVGMYVSNTP